MENEINHLKLEEIVPKNNIPQEKTNDNLQDNLIQSIRNHGIIQPIVVKKNGDKYKIIDGNRRYFAAIKAGLSKIPALVRSDNNSVTRFNLVDDLYNEDLSPIEEAKKYKELLDNNDITQEQLAKNIGKSQSALANKIRLLNLPVEIQNSLNNKEISERHARSLLTVANKDLQLELLNKIKEKKLTVRELDSEIKNMSNMFIPEEFSNNSNNGQNNMFNSENNMNYNQSNNMFMPESSANYNNINNSIFNGNMNQGPLPSNGYNNQNANIDVNSSNNINNQIIPNNNINFNNSANSQMIPNNIIPSNDLKNQMNQYDLPTNNGGMNPFFTSNDYAAPITNPNPNNTNNVNQSNPFSSIRMNTNNLNNSSSSYNNDYNDNNNNFDINDYKLPEYENSNDVNSNLENINSPTPIEQPMVEQNSQYKYVEDNPNYVNILNPEGVSSVDDVIEVLRGALDKIKNGKIKVDTEEIDYDDTYQITIRIDKKGDFL